MQQTSQQRPNGRQTQERQPSELDRLLAKKAKIDKALEARAPTIEECLPDFVKGQAARFIARAKQYWARSPQLQQCTEASFIKCVIEAAELGFAIDGKMVHAVKFNTKKKKAQKSDRDEWEDVAQIIVDYKALIAIAKRHGLVQDVWARIIMPSDKFLYDEINGRPQYGFTPDLDAPRDRADNARGVLAVATHKDGWFRTEWMPMADIMAIKARSPSMKKGDGFGPWVSDPGEMCKKTAIKRLLKTFSDDPGLLRAIEIDDASETPDPDDVPPNERAARLEKILSTPLHDPLITSQTEDNDPPFDPPTASEQAEAHEILAAQAKNAELAPSPGTPTVVNDADAEVLDQWLAALESAASVTELNRLEQEELPKAAAALQPRIMEMLLKRKTAIRSTRGGRS